MDYGKVLLFVPLMIYLLRRAYLEKEKLFLLLAIGCFLGLLYGGVHNVYAVLSESHKAIADSISRFLVAGVCFSYGWIFIKTIGLKKREKNHLT